jgi:hypothetical protein
MLAVARDGIKSMLEDPRTDDQLLMATPREPAAFGAFYRRHEDTVLGWFRS